MRDEGVEPDSDDGPAGSAEAPEPSRGDRVEPDDTGERSGSAQTPEPSRDDRVEPDRQGEPAGPAELHSPDEGDGSDHDPKPGAALEAPEPRDDGLELAADGAPVGSVEAEAQQWDRRWVLGMAGALVFIVAVIVVDVVVIAGNVKHNATVAPSAAVSSPPASKPTASVVGSAVAKGPPVGEVVFQDQNLLEKPSRKRRERSSDDHRTVQQAANRTCSTRSVDGLSRQIIRQARCIDENALVQVPSRPNLEVRKNVYLYMRAPARKHLLQALDDNRGKKMTVTSALRTVAQQYLLWRWASERRCGIKVAATPGESNHETGLALDIANPGTWTKALTKHRFHWLGSFDRVHFDYKGAGSSARSYDVMAFQQLWNSNHPEDRIAANGRYSAATELRLKKSPAAGFDRGPRCR